MSRATACFGFVLLAFLTAGVARAANEGQDDLDNATEVKLNAKTLSDLDEVIRLTESALKKGLDEGNTEFANGLLASTLTQRGALRGGLAMRNLGRESRLAEFRKAALEDLERAVKLDSKQAQAWLSIAQLNRLPGGDEKRSAEALEHALKAAGDDAETKAKALLFRAAVTDDNDKKLADLDEAVRLMPGDANVVRTRGLLKADMGRSEEALSDLNKATELDPQNAPTFEAKAIVLARLKRYEESLKALDEAQKLDPESVSPLVQKARMHVAQTDLKQAMRDLEEAQKLEPANIAILLLRATLEQQPEKKLAILDDAVRVAPKNAMALRARAVLRSDQGNLDGALADLDEALKLQPKETSNYEVKALILSKAKKVDEALAVLDKLSQVDPQQAASARRFRAAVLADAGKHAEAAAELARLLKDDPKDTAAGLQLAVLYSVRKQPSKAIAVYAAMLVEDPKFAPALRGRGDALLNTGKQAEAIVDYEKALELSPHESGLLNNLAWVLCTSPDDKLRDGKRAVKLATEACELTDYKAPHILSTLGAAYAETGDFPSAIKWVEKGLELADEKEKEALGKELENYKANKPSRELLTEKDEPEEKPKDEEKSKDRPDEKK